MQVARRWTPDRPGLRASLPTSRLAAPAPKGRRLAAAVWVLSLALGLDGALAPLNAATVIFEPGLGRLQIQADLGGEVIVVRTPGNTDLILVNGVVLMDTVTNQPVSAASINALVVFGSTARDVINLEGVEFLGEAATVSVDSWAGPDDIFGSPFFSEVLRGGTEIDRIVAQDNDRVHGGGDNDEIVMSPNPTPAPAEGTPPSTYVDGGEDSDSVEVLPIPVILIEDTGAVGTDLLRFRSGIPGEATDDIAMLSETTFDLQGRATATYSGIEELEIVLDEGDDVLTITGIGADSLTIDAGGGHDVLNVAPGLAGQVNHEGFEEVNEVVPTCVPGPTNLCLNQDRFKVEVDWRDFAGNTGRAEVVPFGSDDSGLLWFFSAENWEVLIKVLNGCGFNQHFWVFSAATTNVEYTLRVIDTVAEMTQEYFNPLGTAAAAITDTFAFETCAAGASGPPDRGRRERSFAALAALRDLPQLERQAPVSPDETCTPSETSLCLNAGRFRVEVEWEDFVGNIGNGEVVPFGSDDSGLLWFFAEDNWEMLIKVLNGCGFNGHYWVFSAATTNVEYLLRVTDTLTGEVQEYLNPLGTAADAITDTAAFDDCP